MHIKAIDTRYGGYLFRSRLEARWAVFFDQLGLKWEYEPEGLDLEAGQYLPDFYFREPDLFVEVKPMWPSPLEDETAKRFGKEIADSGSGFVLVYGDPLDLYLHATKPQPSFHTPVWNRPSVWFHERTGNVGHSERVDAARYARAARFEHGARP